VGVRRGSLVTLRQVPLVILAAGRARRYGGLKQLAPIGINGEGVIDLVASDAYAAGFNHIVLVINEDTGPAIKSHVDEYWPDSQDVSFAVQEHAYGTVHAVLAAKSLLDPSVPFGVANADDLYGLEAMTKLSEHLSHEATSCLVGYQLDRALVNDLPVSRGVCEIADGKLVSIRERHHVQLTDKGFVANDGQLPRHLEPDTPVSMNLWGFQSYVWEAFERALLAHEVSEDSEIRLPDVVAELLAHHRFDVLANASRCVGVTHAEDLPLVQADVREQVARGERPARAFSL
jgi:NDP-sugar pyrophosphorylase family protein